MTERIPASGDMSNREDYRIDSPELITLKMNAIFSLEILLAMNRPGIRSGVLQHYFDGTIVRELNMSFSDDEREKDNQREERVIFANGENMHSIRLRRAAYLSDVAIHASRYNNGLLLDSFYVGMRGRVQDDDTQRIFTTSYRFSRIASTTNIVDAEVSRSNDAFRLRGKEDSEVFQLFGAEAKDGLDERMMTQFDLRDFQKQINLMTATRKAELSREVQRVKESEYELDFE